MSIESRWRQRERGPGIGGKRDETNERVSGSPDTTTTAPETFLATGSFVDRLRNALSSSPSSFLTEIYFQAIVGIAKRESITPGRDYCLNKRFMGKLFVLLGNSSRRGAAVLYSSLACQ